MADGTRDETENIIIKEFLATRSEDSYARLFRAFASQLLSFFTIRGCEQALAEDLTQEVLLTVYRKHGDLRDAGLFRPWLFKIARNAMLQDRRSSLRRIETIDLCAGMDTSAVTGTGTPQAFIADFASLTDFEKMMSQLQPDERQIMTLRYLEELEYHEIASALDLPLGTVQWKIFHSKKKLAAIFKNGISKKRGR